VHTNCSSIVLLERLPESCILYIENVLLKRVDKSVVIKFKRATSRELSITVETFQEKCIRMLLSVLIFDSRLTF